MKCKFKSEWNDAELKMANKAFATWERQNLRITHGDRERNAEDTYGLPYTSSSSFAGIWNTNVEAVLKSDEQYRFVGVAITEDNQVAVLLETENEESEKIILI